MDWASDTYPDALEWIGDILNRRTVDISEQDRQGFSKYLLDRALATDALVEVRNNHGEIVRIAVDVTIKKSQEEAKLSKIRGMPDPNDAAGLNRNKNFSVIRKELKIDKHVILVLNGHKDKLPSYEKLLTEIYGLANSRSNTKSINLVSVLENERFVENPVVLLKPKELWERCIQGLPKQAGPENSTKACMRAIRTGVSKEDIFRMLQEDPQSSKLKPDQAAHYSQLIYDRARERIDLQKSTSLSQRDINRRGLRAARFIVAHVGKNQANGDRVAKGGNLVTMTQRGDDFKIERSDERGVILSLKDKRLSGSLSIRDLQTFEELAGQFQAAAQKEAAAQKDSDLEL